MTKDKYGYEAIAAALDAHISVLCADAPKHVEAFYRLWFEALAPESQLKPVILGIHKRRRGDVINWIEQGIERGLLAPSLDTALIADHFTASVSGIVYHWMSDPDNLDEMRTNHNGLKQVMRAMLAAR